MTKALKTLLLALAIVVSPLYAYSSTIDTLAAPEKRKSELRQIRRDSIRAHKKVWFSILGGPSYTPEASLGIAAAMLASFKIDKSDTISQRSYIPMGLNVSLNGTIVAAGAGNLFFKENKFRVYLKYGYREEPSHYFGKGYDEIEHVSQGKSTTEFHKRNLQFNPHFYWQVRPRLFLGALLDVNYTKSSKINDYMAHNTYVNKYGLEYLNMGLGLTVQYDTRDDVATPASGLLLSGTGKFYSPWFGGDYDFQIVEFEYRHFVSLFNRRSVLGWTVKSQIGFNDIPFTELPMYGSPFDLRGYYWGKYRDKSMAYGIVEYRHMFGSNEAYQKGRFFSKFGVVVWAGTGTIGDTPAQWTKWKFNYGAGLRIQLQPRKNLRLDIGKEPGTKGVLFYMNMTEAF